MKWRRLLKANLSDLLRGNIPPDPEAEPKIEAEVETDSNPDGSLREDLPIILREIVRTVPRIIGGVISFPFTIFLPRHARDLLLVTEQLGRITACNAPLIPALDAVAADAANYRVTYSLLSLRNVLAQGWTLSDAMRCQEHMFPRYYVDLMEAGENTGSVRDTLRDLGRLLADAHRLRTVTRLSLFYVCVLFVFTSLVTLFYMVKIYPVFTEILADFGAAPIGPARGLQRLGNAISNAPPVDELTIGLTFGVLMAGIVAAFFFWRSAYARHLRRSIAMALPGLRRVVAKPYLAHASNVLAKLLRAGYPAHEALETAAAGDLPPQIAQALRGMSDYARIGHSFGEISEDQTRVLPPSFRAMLVLGESTGQVPEALERVADLYRLQAYKTQSFITNAVIPAGVLVAGCGVLVISSLTFTITAQLADLLLASM
ncbi:MAG: hypothetical protein GWP08_14560 [Nitrospiraceae bacterium]|nr:hypothetical protein [Nitrospiraceae bacterium]